MTRNNAGKRTAYTLGWSKLASLGIVAAVLVAISPIASHAQTTARRILTCSPFYPRL
jgi:hypothetical protein